VLDTIRQRYWSFIPRRGSGRREERAIRRDLVPGAIERARDGAMLARTS
jgi:FO synthase